MTAHSQPLPSNSPQKTVKTAITPTRAENFPEWFQSVIRAAELAENSPVRGCMTIRPNGYALWEQVQRALDDLIKEAGVQNAYFPLLIPLSFLSREAEHIDGFAKETAVVTHHRVEKDGKGGLRPAPSAELEEPYVIRPTSETIIGEAMSRWIQSYRDLPMKLNQWANVMRWEMRTRMFLRTAEFLWQEGHNAFATEQEAMDDMTKMLRVYESVYRDHMAIAGIPGEKTADERFPGADRSVTVEAMMQDGKALQACTSHFLGQHFSKSFDIKFQGEDGQQHLVYTTSWGFSTRSIGGLIMSHADDDGMIVPPKIAPQQVVILPVIRDEQGRTPVMDYIATLAKRLKAQGIRVHVDDSAARTPDKMWNAIKRGVPVRVEIGQREVEEGKLTYVRRDLGKDSKATVTADEFAATINGILDAMQADLLERNRNLTRSRITDVKSIAEIGEFYKGDGVGFVRADVSVLTDPALESVYKEHALSNRCMPFEDEGRKVLIGKSY